MRISSLTFYIMKVQIISRKNVLNLIDSVFNQPKSKEFNYLRSTTFFSNFRFSSYHLDACNRHHASV